MSRRSTNNKRSARNLMAENGLTYQQALALVLAGETPVGHIPAMPKPTVNVPEGTHPCAFCDQNVTAALTETGTIAWLYLNEYGFDPALCEDNDLDGTHGFWDPLAGIDSGPCSSFLYDEGNPDGDTFCVICFHNQDEHENAPTTPPMIASFAARLAEASYVVSTWMASPGGNRLVPRTAVREVVGARTPLQITLTDPETPLGTTTLDLDFYDYPDKAARHTVDPDGLGLTLRNWDGTVASTYRILDASTPVGTCHYCGQPRLFPIEAEGERFNLFLPGSVCLNCGHIEPESEVESNEWLFTLDGEGTIRYIDNDGNTEHVFTIDDEEWERYCEPLNASKERVMKALAGLDSDY